MPKKREDTFVACHHPMTQKFSYGYQKLMTTKSSYTSGFCNIIVQASSSSSFPMRSIYGNEKDEHSKDDYSLSTLQLHNPIRSERCFCWRECTSAPLLTPRCQPKALLTGNMHVILLILFLRVHSLRFFLLENVLVLKQHLTHKLNYSM